MYIYMLWMRNEQLRLLLIQFTKYHMLYVSSAVHPFLQAHGLVQRRGLVDVTACGLDRPGCPQWSGVLYRDRQ
jgi:hypothetical protein